MISNDKTVRPAQTAPPHRMRAKEQGGAMLNRVEIKYLIDRTTRTALTRDLKALMQPDVHAGGENGYLVRSLYFDTPDYLAYHEKLSGMATRNKLRIRSYSQASGESTFVRLEVKARHMASIKKLMKDISTAEYRLVEDALRRRTLPPSHLLEDNSSIKEFFRLQRQYNMEPKVLIQYRRQAFERNELYRARANFDDELVATRNFDLLGPLQGARRLLRYGHAVFELKVDGAMPQWAHMLIAKYNMQNEAISKYCFAVRSEARLSTIGRADDEY